MPDVIPRVVGNDLRVDMLVALENRNPRTLIRPHNLFANPLFSPRAGQCLFACLPSILILNATRFLPSQLLFPLCAG